MQPAPVYFQVSPSSGEPIYRQLIDQINRMLAGGQLKSGDYLPSVRQLAGQLDVNPMTISKAYGFLEAQGQVERIRGKGMMVVQTAQQTSIEERLDLLNPLAESLISQSKQLEISKPELLGWLHKKINKEM